MQSRKSHPVEAEVACSLSALHMETPVLRDDRCPPDLVRNAESGNHTCSPLHLSDLAPAATDMRVGRLASRGALAVLESIDEACLAVDEHFRFTFVNRRWENLFSIPRTKVLGHTLSVVLPQLVGTDVERIFKTVLSRREPVESEVMCPILGRSLKVRAFPAPGNGLSIFVSDIRERRHPRETPDLAMESLALTEEVSGSGLADWEPTGKEACVSRRFRAMHGLASDRPVTLKGWLSTIVRRDRPCVLQQLRNVLKDGKDRSTEYRIIHPSIGERWFRGHVRLLRDAHDHPLRFVGVSIDITERKLLEQSVLEISAWERQHIGQDLHDDVCQWLTGIEYQAQALAERLAALAPQEAAHATTIAHYLGTASAHTRAFARGLSPITVESSGLPAALHGLAAHIQELFRIECHCVTTGQLPDRGPEAALHLYRIAQEAASNAIRHGGAQRVAISLKGVRDRFRLLIADDGSGITHPERNAGMGLRTMRYRAGAIGAKLAVRVGRHGGTEVACYSSRQA